MVRLDIEVINIEQKFLYINKLHSYKIIAKMNDYYFKLVRMQREFIWHKHEETDEVFIVIEGNLTIDLRDKRLNLSKCDMVVIPKGIEHKPSSDKECKILLIEPISTVNTGNVRSKLTDPNLEWI